MNPFLLCAVAVGALVQVTPAFAQDQNAEPQSPIIVVTGQGLKETPGNPAYGSVEIERDRLENSASGRIENILGDVAGFQQFRRSDSRSSNPSAQGATLRSLGGNASSRTPILLDGVPQADPFFGYIPFSAITPERLSSVRVTRGGGNGAFGAGAVAGTIELNSATRADLPRFGASALYGSDNASEISAALTADLGGGYVTASGRWDQGDGFFTTPENTRQPSDVRAAYESWSAGIRGVAPLSPDLELQTRVLVFRDNRTLRFAGADSSSDGEDASVRLVSRGLWQVDALAYVQARNFTNVVISATSLRKTLDQRNTPSTGIGGKIELRPPVGGAHELRFGADIRLAEGELFEDAYSAATGLVTARRNAGGRTSTLGLYVEDDWTLERLVLTGGVRADRWTITEGFFTERTAAGISTRDAQFAKRSDWQGSVRAGALFRASDVLSLRAAGYTGFRLPTLNELYRPFTVFPVVTQANEALDPETLKGVEAGFDFRPGKDITFGVTAFYNRLDNAIANVTISNNLRQRQNVDAIIAKGIELTGSIALNDFSLSGSYAYSHSTVRASGASAALNGLTPAQSPRHAASATLGWARESGPALSTTIRYVGKQFEDDLQANTLPDALTVDGFARIPLFKQVQVIARVENIFDTQVVTRQVGSSIDLGAPRTFWIGLRLGIQ